MGLLEKVRTHVIEHHSDEILSDIGYQSMSDVPSYAIDRWVDRMSNTKLLATLDAIADDAGESP